jgi:hypothetical protein
MFISLFYKEYTEQEFKRLTYNERTGAYDKTLE